MEQPVDNSQRTWAMACHLSALSGILFPLMVFLGPLMVWLAKKNDSSFIDDQGKESVNFQLSITLYTLVLWFILLIVGVILPLIKVTMGEVQSSDLLFYLILVPFIVILYVFDLVEIIIASIKASNGEAHRYPLRIRFIK